MIILVGMAAVIAVKICSTHALLQQYHQTISRGALYAAGHPKTIAITDDIKDLRRERMFIYDTRVYALAEGITNVLQEMMIATNSDAHRSIDSLNDIHLHRFASETIIDGAGAVLSKLQYTWNLYRDRENIPQQQKGLRDAYYNFDALYHRFIREEIAPHIVTSTGGLVVYQASPSLRIYHPSTVAMGKLHCDEDYHHQPSELNYWVPISERTYGSNSLWVESEPLKGDFRPIDLSRGSYLRFYGNKCRHKTLPNDSSHSRVSLDFRALSNRSGGHDPLFRKGIRRGSKAKYSRSFDIGGFYDCLTL